MTVQSSPDKGSNPGSPPQNPLMPHFISPSYFYKKVTLFDYNDKKEYAT